jgi:hypothetical protein
MPCRRAWVFVVMFAMGTGAWVDEAHAQPPPWGRNEPRESKWMLGLAAGLWGLTQPLDDARRSGAFDFSVQRQFEGMWNDGGDGHGTIRVQVGHGSRYSSGDSSFDYRRVTLGMFREFCIPFPQAPTYIHLGGGVGRYRVSSAGKRVAKSSLFAEAGFDVRLGESPLTLGPELQVHTIGDRLYATTSIVARFTCRNR